MQGKITIKAEIPEKEYMESILNMNYSGYDIALPFFLYAFTKRWHIDKLNYYLRLLNKK